VTWKQFGSGPACGMLYKVTPGEVAFLMCGDQIVAGPLTTLGHLWFVQEQVQDALDRLAKEGVSPLKLASEVARSVGEVKPRPKQICKACRFEIYDQRGKLVRAE
jgi:hypothetical protein